MLDLDKIRDRHSSDRIQTHSEECYLWHPHCAIFKLCDELEKARKQIAALKQVVLDKSRL